MSLCGPRHVARESAEHIDVVNSFMVFTTHLESAPVQNRRLGADEISEENEVDAGEG